MEFVARLVGLAWTLMLVTVGLMVWLFFAQWARRQPWVVLLPLGAIIVLTPKTGAEPIASPAGLAVLPIDAVIAVCSLAALLGWGTLVRRLMGRRLMASVFCALLLIQVTVGLSEFKSAAMVEARHTIALVAIAAYVLSLEESPELRIRRWLYGTATGLCVLAAFRAVTEGLGHADLLSEDYITTRVIVAGQAIVVAAAALAAWHDWVRDRGTRHFLTFVVFALVVALAQHRSVWVATLAGFVLVLPRIPISKLALRVAIFLWALALVSPVLVLTPIGTEIADVVTGATKSASLDSGTGGDRTESALALIDEAMTDGPIRALFGEPYGSGYERVVYGRLETYHPHNAYVEMLMRVGLLGLAATAVLIFSGWRRAMTKRGVDQTCAGWIPLVAVFSFAYAFPVELAPLIGLALANRLDDRASGITPGGAVGPDRLAESGVVEHRPSPGGGRARA